MAIQKRYEYWGTENGKPVVKWTDWKDYIDDDSKLEYLQKEEPYQLKPKLRNEYRVV